MKRKKAFLIGIVFAAVMTVGCSGNEAASGTVEETGSEVSKESMDAAEGGGRTKDMLFGKVTETGKDYIIVEKTGNPGRAHDSQEAADDDGEDLKEEKGAEEGAGETQEIKIDEDTVIRRVSMEMPEGGERPERPDGEKPNGTNAPQQPEGENPPQKGEGEQPPEIPEESGEADKGSGQPRGGFAEDEGEEIALSDIAEGNQVSVVLGDDGIADKIMVMEKADTGTAKETTA